MRFKVKMHSFWKELRAVWAICIKVWKDELSYPLSVTYFIFAPIMWLLPFIIFGFAIVGGRYSPFLEKLTGIGDIVTYTVLGFAFLGFASAALWGTAMSLRREQWIGTLESVLVTPVSRFSIIFGQGLHSVTHTGSGVVLQLVAIIIVFGIHLNLWGLLPSLMSVALTILAIQGVGFMICSIVLMVKQGWMVIDVVDTVFWVVTPTAYPITILPAFLQTIAKISPMTYGVESFRGFLLYGPGQMWIWQNIVILAVLDIVYLALGYFIYLKSEEKIKKTGTVHKF